MNITIEKTKENNPDILPALVDVPVKVMIWTRCELQKKQFEILRKARPSVIFFVSDGGRTEWERQRIRESREIVSKVDWECTVHRLYWEENQGMYSTAKQSNQYVFSHVDRIMLLEDDIMPAVSYFTFCSENLERYKDDLRVAVICGMNHLGVYDRPNTDYFFSRVGGIWGTATWKRVYDTYGDFSFGKDEYVLDEVCKIAKKDTYFCKAMHGYAANDTFDGHEPGEEFYFVLNMFAQNQLYIIPTKNMVSCHGLADGSTHAANDIRKLAKGDAQFFFAKVHELEGEMKHPKYVFPDLTYEKRQKRVTAWHHPVVKRYRRTVYLMKCIRYGDGGLLLRKFWMKLKKKLLKEEKYEK